MSGSSAASSSPAAPAGRSWRRGCRTLLGSRPLGGRQHGRRHRDRRGRRLPRPRPGHLLADGRDRRGARAGGSRTTPSPSSTGWSSSARPTGSGSPTAISPPASTGREFVAEGGRRTDAQAQIARALGVEAAGPADVRGAGPHPGEDRRGLARPAGVSWSPSTPRPAVEEVEVEGIARRTPTRRGARGDRRCRGDRDRALEPGDLDRADRLHAGRARGDSAARRAGRRRQPLRGRPGGQGTDRSASCARSAARRPPPGAPRSTRGLLDGMICDPEDPDPPPEDIR